MVLYQWNGALSIDFIGQIQTPYSNRVKVDGNNIGFNRRWCFYIYFKLNRSYNGI